MFSFSVIVLFNFQFGLKTCERTATTTQLNANNIRKYSNFLHSNV